MRETPRSTGVQPWPSARGLSAVGGPGRIPLAFDRGRTPGAGVLIGAAARTETPCRSQILMVRRVRAADSSWHRPGSVDDNHSSRPTESVTLQFHPALVFGRVVSPAVAHAVRAQPGCRRAVSLSLYAASDGERCESEEDRLGEP
jgi:hypothetical protein